MIVYFWSKDRQLVTAIDRYESLIWTERYLEAGDFELQMPYDPDFLESVVKNAFYVTIPDSNRTMLVEKDTTTNTDSDKHIKIEGSSVERLMDRRILLDDHGPTEVYDLFYYPLQGAYIAPMDSRRKWDDVFWDGARSNAEAAILMSGELGSGTRWKNLYEHFVDTAALYNVGWRMIHLSRGSLGGNFRFQLYLGRDRTFDGTHESVYFSLPEGTMANFTRERDRSLIKTLSYISGETTPEGILRWNTAAKEGHALNEGLDRREVYISAPSITSTRDDESTIPAQEYMRMLSDHGRAETARMNNSDLFDGEVAIDNPKYQYETHYYLGDIVDVHLTPSGSISSRARVMEYIRAYTPSESKAYPTLQFISDNPPVPPPPPPPAPISIIGVGNWNPSGTKTMITNGSRYDAFPDATRLDSGRIVATWCSYESHYGPGHGVSAYSMDNGLTWSSPTQLISGVNHVGAVGVASLGNRVAALHMSLDTPNRSAWVQISNTSGATWGIPIEITGWNNSGWIFPSDILWIDNSTADGLLLVTSYGPDGIIVMASTNAGSSWTRRANPVKRDVWQDTTETAMAVLANGDILMLLRNDTRTTIEMLRSSDMGNTWTTPVVIFNNMSGLPRPTVMPGGTIVATLRDQRSTVLPMQGYVLASSHDGGYTWKSKRIMDERMMYGRVVPINNTQAVLIGANDSRTSTGPSWIWRLLLNRT